MDRIYYLFLVPTLVLFTLAITVPAVLGIFYSFTNFIGFGDWEFIGLTNYIAVFSDPAILSSYLFTFGFAIVTVLLVNVIAFLLAIGLTSRIRLKTGLRAVFVIPMVISGIVIAFVFNFLFSNSLPALGSSPRHPLAVGVDPRQPGSRLARDRHRVGVAVDPRHAPHLHRRAALDPGRGLRSRGHRRRHAPRYRLRSVTLPLVAGYVVINVILGFKNYLNVYDVIVGLTNGGPGTATRSIAMTIFTGFTGGDYAYQMANATIFFIIAVLISVLQLRLTRGRAAIS